jgi:hypothetical protein
MSNVEEIDRLTAEVERLRGEIDPLRKEVAALERRHKCAHSGLSVASCQDSDLCDCFGGSTWPQLAMQAQADALTARAERDRARDLAAHLEAELATGATCGCTARARAAHDMFGCYCDCAEYGYDGCEHQS